MDDALPKTPDTINTKIKGKSHFWECLRLKYIYHRIIDEWTPYTVYCKVKGFWQRGTRGYADYDVWNFDHYLAGVIAGGVQKLRDTSIGYPCAFGEDSEEAQRKYNEALDEIVRGFKLWAEDDDYNETEDKLNKSLEVFSKWFVTLWD